MKKCIYEIFYGKMHSFFSVEEEKNVKEKDFTDPVISKYVDYIQLGRI